MANPHVITILDFDTSNGDLVLDRNDLEAYSRDFVQWKVKRGLGIKISNITEKEEIEDVWEIRPLGNNMWKGKIKKYAPCNYEYEYNICWIKDNKTYEYDPKIAINPTSSSKSLFFTLISLLGLSAILFLFRNEIRKIVKLS